MSRKCTLCHLLLGFTVYSVFCKPSHVRGAYYVKKYMVSSTSQCTPQLDLSADDAGKLSLTTAPYYEQSEWECVTRLTCGGGGGGGAGTGCEERRQRILLNLLTMDINRRDSLDVYEGGGGAAGGDLRTANYLYSLTGMYSSRREFTTSRPGADMLLRFRSVSKPAAELQRHAKRHSGFTFIYTIYSDHVPCSSDLYNCSNNRCVDSSLVCDQYDNCGDYSDEGDALCGSLVRDNTGNNDLDMEGGGEVVAIALGCMILIFASIACLFYITKRYREPAAAADCSSRGAAYSIGDGGGVAGKPPAATPGSPPVGSAALSSTGMEFSNPLATGSDTEATLRTSAATRNGNGTNQGTDDGARY